MEDEAISVAAGGRANSAGVGSSVVLRDAERHVELSRRRRGEGAALQLLGAVMDHRAHSEDREVKRRRRVLGARTLRDGAEQHTRVQAAEACSPVRAATVQKLGRGVTPVMVQSHYRPRSVHSLSSAVPVTVPVLVMLSAPVPRLTA